MRFVLFLALMFSMTGLSVEYQRGLVRPKDFKQTSFIKMPKMRGDLPAEWDWRTKVTLSPIMNQGNCGSCWAFSATSTFRDNMVVQAGQQGDGSEKYMLDCNDQNYGCQGGYFDSAELLLKKGSVRLAQYSPYNAKKETCKSNTPFLKATTWGYVVDMGNQATEVEQIKQAIMVYGPVSVGVAAGSSWNSYTGGIYTSCSNKTPNHAVQIAGWKDDSSINGGGYWILRNSWGQSWGEQGWMRIAFKDSAGKNCDFVGELANVFTITGTPPGPTPEPTPGPNPDPTPTPPPTPPPGPCLLPEATTGWPAELTASAGKTYQMGKNPKKTKDRISFVWVADPAFESGAVPKTAVIRYTPIKTKTLTVTYTNKCGSTSASTKVLLDPVSKKGLYK